MLLLIHPAALLLAEAGENLDSSFSDLGELMIGGVLIAIGLAFVIAFVRIKLQSRRESAPDLSSINPAKQRKRE